MTGWGARGSANECRRVSGVSCFSLFLNAKYSYLSKLSYLKSHVTPRPHALHCTKIVQKGQFRSLLFPIPSTNAHHFARPALAQRERPNNQRLRITVENREYHYLSHPEIASDKRISQQLFPLSGPGGQNLAEERLNRDCLSGALLS